MKLPNLLIAGVPKCGTTSLFWYMAQHPDIFASPIKELGYFTPARVNNGLVEPLPKYAESFEHWTTERYAMEGTPAYAYGGKPVIAAIQEALGAPRIIISLRDPVRRMWSAYTAIRSRGRTSMLNNTIDDFIDECAEQRRIGNDKALGNRRIALSVGYYADYIPLWLDTFGDGIMIVFSEQLFKDTPHVVGDVFGWLDLDTSVADSLEYEARNKTVGVRNTALARAAWGVKPVRDSLLRNQPRVRERLGRVYSGLNTGELADDYPTAAQDRLAEFYAPSNRMLAERLRAEGYDDLPAWLRAS